MAFLTGLLLLDAPAAALNNQQDIPGEREKNTSAVKYIRTPEGTYPYVSAQSLRYWIRSTLERYFPRWKVSPISRETKISFTDGDPILYWDDDLFGYMRVTPKDAAKKRRETDQTQSDEPATRDAISRITPFRVTPLVSVAPVMLANDFGVMARQEEYPVIFRHQFYRATLFGLFSLDLERCGTFTYINRSGYRNLDEKRIQEAKEIDDIEDLKEQKAYRLPLSQRVERITTFLESLTCIEGGAKQGLHYTDTTPDLLLMAITRGGNNLFGHVMTTIKGKPVLNLVAFEEALRVHQDQLLSPIYLGWTRGFLDDQRDRLDASLQGISQPPWLVSLKDYAASIQINHPRLVMQDMIKTFAEPQNQRSWLDGSKGKRGESCVFSK
jgi:CRISPR-associated protein Cst2